MLPLVHLSFSVTPTGLTLLKKTPRTGQETEHSDVPVKALIENELKRVLLLRALQESVAETISSLDSLMLFSITSIDTCDFLEHYAVLRLGRFGGGADGPNDTMPELTDIASGLPSPEHWWRIDRDRPDGQATMTIIPNEQGQWACKFIESSDFIAHPERLDGRCTRQSPSQITLLITSQTCSASIAKIMKSFLQKHHVIQELVHRSLSLRLQQGGIQLE